MSVIQAQGLRDKGRLRRPEKQQDRKNNVTLFPDKELEGEGRGSPGADSDRKWAIYL